MNTQTDNLNFQVSAQDIILMVNIISTVSKRGAFQPEEFQIVGALFEKLKSFVVEKEEQLEQLELDFPTTEQ
jgi:hypothetical protein